MDITHTLHTNEIKTPSTIINMFVVYEKLDSKWRLQVAGAVVGKCLWLYFWWEIITFWPYCWVLGFHRGKMVVIDIGNWSSETSLVPGRGKRSRISFNLESFQALDSNCSCMFLSTRTIYVRREMPRVLFSVFLLSQCAEIELVINNWTRKCLA